MNAPLVVLVETLARAPYLSKKETDKGVSIPECPRASMD